jgi:5-oxopent-3-ene-1,2,5-tricarboxylate decarboxylase/2-hydroxyhepta-2,4-diene-1,7-dioate isomerase
MSSLSTVLNFDAAPYRLSGVVYGTLMNHLDALESLGDAVNQLPYKAAPQAPVLYIKPRNTLTVDGEAIEVPDDVEELEVGASLGIVIKKSACKLNLNNALEYVAGYTIVHDVSVPHESFYRPSIRFKARDKFCSIGPRVASASTFQSPDSAVVRVFVDDVLIQTTTTADRIRGVVQLLISVTEFMTLQAGDILMLGVSSQAPRVRANQSVAIEIDGIGRLTNRFVAEGAAK